MTRQDRGPGGTRPANALPSPQPAVEGPSDSWSATGQTIGFIGSGNIGGSIARLAVGAGYRVVVSNSRAPATLAELTGELGRHANAATPAEAALAGDIVVISIPLRAANQLPAGLLTGKVVLDTLNYSPQRDGQIAELAQGSSTPGTFLQSRLPGARVVRGFTTMNHRAIPALARPAGATDRSALPIAGDDANARAIIAAFLDRIGFDAVDAGPLAEAWRFERGTPAFADPYAGPAGLEDPSPASAQEIRTKLAQAQLVEPGAQASRRPLWSPRTEE